LPASGFWPVLQASGGSSLTLLTSDGLLRLVLCVLHLVLCGLLLTAQVSGGLPRLALCGLLLISQASSG
jgi:hypothetical protein